jgi:hypothetical protein
MQIQGADTIQPDMTLFQTQPEDTQVSATFNNGITQNPQILQKTVNMIEELAIIAETQCNWKRSKDKLNTLPS